MIYIRTDVNRIIGTGHMVRCISVAEAVGMLGEEVTFIVSDSDSEKFIKSKSYKTICLNTKWDLLETEIEKIEAFLQKTDVPVLLIDSYFVSCNYLKVCRKYTKVVYIDDLHAAIWPCDALVNYSNYWDKYDYAFEYPDAKLLLGCQYAPLRKGFAGVKKIVHSHISKVLILTGGTDPYHFARDFVYSLPENADNIEFDIICGMYNLDLKELQNYAVGKSHIRIWHNVQQIFELMKEADFAITAGGTTLYELAACGTPTLCYSFVDNQLENVRSFADKGYMIYYGDLRNGVNYSEIWKTIDKLEDDFWQRKNMSQRLQELVDGRGAERLARQILQMR